MSRLYLTAREYDSLFERQGGECCVRGYRETEGLITPRARAV